MEKQIEQLIKRTYLWYELSLESPRKEMGLSVNQQMGQQFNLSPLSVEAIPYKCALSFRCNSLVSFYSTKKERKAKCYFKVHSFVPKGLGLFIHNTRVLNPRRFYISQPDLLKMSSMYMNTETYSLNYKRKSDLNAMKRLWMHGQTCTIGLGTIGLGSQQSQQRRLKCYTNKAPNMHWESWTISRIPEEAWLEWCKEDTRLTCSVGPGRLTV